MAFNKWSRGGKIKAEERATVQIGGKTFTGWSVFPSRFPGTRARGTECAATGLEFPAGCRIAFGTDDSGRKRSVIYPQSNAAQTVADAYTARGLPIPADVAKLLAGDGTHAAARDMAARAVAVEEENRPAAKSLTFDSFQRAVIDAFLSLSLHLAVIAGAGSGKTTLVVRGLLTEARKRRPAMVRRTLHLMFNAKNRLETSAELLKVPAATCNATGRSCESVAHTFASYGLSRILARYPGRGAVKLRGVQGESRDAKLWSIFKENNAAILRETGIDEKKLDLTRSPAFTLVNRAKAFNLAPDCGAEKIKEAIGCELGGTNPLDCGKADPSDVAQLAAAILRRCAPVAGNRQEVDFSDMVWWLSRQLDGISVDADFTGVFPDEGQDYDTAQIAILEQLAATGARICIVGDRCQAIYGWRPCDCQSLDTVLAMLAGTSRGAQSFDMPINYRCSRAVVARAQQVGHGWEKLQAHDGAEEGAARTGTVSELLSTCEPGDAVISRTNAPLIDIALRLLEAGKPVCLAGGKEAAAEIVGIVDTVCGNKSLPLAAFLEKLEEYERQQTARLENAKGMGMRLDAIRNQCVACRLLAARPFVEVHGRRIEIETSRDVVAVVNALVVDDGGNKFRAVNLMSGHRCKGLQFPRVWSLTPDLYPHPRATGDAAIVQEYNLLGVVITRAEREVIEITDCEVPGADGND